MFRIFHRFRTVFMFLLSFLSFDIAANTISIDNNAVKLICVQEGLYKIKKSDLQKMNWSGLNYPSAYFHLISAEGEVPIYFNEENGNWKSFEFWIDDNLKTESYSPFPYNILWLTVGNNLGLRYSIEAPTTQNQNDFYLTPSFYRSSISIQNKVFERFPHPSLPDNMDYWFCLSRLPGNMQTNITFDLPDLFEFSSSQFSCFLTVYFYSDENLKGQFKIYINQKAVAIQEVPTNQKVKCCIHSLKNIDLKETGNVLTIINENTDEKTLLYVDSIEFHYPISVVTHHDQLHFSVPDSLIARPIQFYLQGFNSSNITILKKHTSRLVPFSITKKHDTDLDSCTVVFRDKQLTSETEYIVCTEEKKLRPESMTIETTLTDWSPADMFIVVPHDSFQTAKIWKKYQAYLKKQGFTSKLINISSIYNQYSCGYPHPNSIQKWIQDLTLLHKAPQFLLLIGIGKTDLTKEYSDGNLCPVPIYHSVKYGATPSDFLFVNSSSSDNISIGRLPIENLDELKNCLQKIIDYSNTTVDPWMNRYLSIVSSSTISAFVSQSEYLVKHVIPPSMEADRFYITKQDIDMNVDYFDILKNHFSNGVLLINYRGHGGNMVWSHADLLNRDTVTEIRNATKLPFIFSLTCFTANFTFSSDCLGEALLCQSQNGAVGFLGASGYGWVEKDFAFAQIFYDILFNNRKFPIGKVIHLAKKRFLEENPGPLAQSTANQYILLGDPSLVLAIPDIDEEPPVAIQNQSEITCSTFDKNTQITISGIDTTGRTVWWNNTNSKSNPIYVLNQDEQLRTDRIRYYQWNTQKNISSHGILTMNPQKQWIDSVYTIPSNPTETDSVYIFVSCNSGITNLELILSKPYEAILPLIQSKNGHFWKTANTLLPFQGGTTYHYKIQGFRDTNPIISNEHFIPIRSLGSLTIPSIEMCGQTHPTLALILQNLGDSDISDKKIKILCPTLQYQACFKINLEPKTVDTLKIPFDAPPGEWPIKIDYSDSGSDFHKEFLLKADHFLITPQRGSRQTFSKSGSIGFEEECMVSIAPQCVSDSTVMAISMTNHNNQPIYQLKLSRPSTWFEQPFNVLFYNALLQDENLRPYQYSEQNKNWTALPFNKTDEYIIATATKPGRFCLQACNDTIPPEFEVQTKHQILTPSTTISTHPEFSILLEDDSGIDFENDHFNLFLNDERVDLDRLGIHNQMADIKNVSLHFHPQLNCGKHSLKISCQDIHGNKARQKEYTFCATEKIALDFLGNYPNPFKDKTIFAMNISGEIYQTSISIFSVSGRKIRKIKAFMPMTDYLELTWDGCNEQGEEIPNGVYFYKITVKGKHHSESYIGKAAKIK